MKNLIFIVLLVIVAIAGYSIMNKPTEAVAVTEVSVKDTASDTTTEQATEVIDEVTSTETKELNLITPADMSEQAQDEMYTHIMEYNKCMMQNRLEYHQQGVRAESVADKTLSACEPHLDELKLVLEANNVNQGLREGMVKTMRQRAARKLMSNVMQSLAGQAAAAASTAPVTP